MRNIPLQQLLQQMRHTTSLIHQRLSTTGTVHYGSMSITYAIQQSRNVTCGEGPGKVGLKQAKKFLNGLGIDYPEMVYANAISSNTSDSSNKYGASSEKMAAAYAAFANGGTYYKPSYVSRVVFSDGNNQGNLSPKELVQ